MSMRYWSLVSISWQNAELSRHNPKRATNSHQLLLDQETPRLFSTKYPQDMQIDDLVPLEVDDEYILDDQILPQPLGRPSLTNGLRILTRLYSLALETPQSVNFRDAASLKRQDVLSREQVRLETLKSGFLELKHALDDIPEEFGEWVVRPGVNAFETGASPLVGQQFEIMRANIRVTHLWLQSIILEDIISVSTEDLTTRAPTGVSSLELQSLWDCREEICRQLLHVLFNISHANLEPNGASLVRLIRTETSWCTI
jgi:hypothetical protein